MLNRDKVTYLNVFSHSELCNWMVLVEVKLSLSKPYNHFWGGNADSWLKTTEAFQDTSVLWQIIKPD